MRDVNIAASIAAERPDSAASLLLIEELEAELDPLYPDESRHGYSVEQLVAENVAFFVTRVENMPAGCAGIKLFGTEYGEAKRMYVRPAFRGRGLGVLMLEHLAEYARERGVGLLRLETGIHQHDAIRLYEGWGFENVAPFGEYKPDPNSLFFEKRIA